jgi:hypothetical protein
MGAVATDDSDTAVAHDAGGGVDRRRSADTELSARVARMRRRSW